MLSMNSINAQINIGRKIETKVNNRVNNKIDRGIDKGLDEIEKGIKGEKTPDEKPKTEDKTKTRSSGAEVKTDGKETASDNLSLQSYSKYDFVPGDKVLLYDDFSQDAVGDFPALWTANAPGEINTVSIAPGNWFNLNSTDGNYFYLNDIDFPKNFIIEFDIIPKTKGGRIAAGLLHFGEKKRKKMEYIFFEKKCFLYYIFRKKY